MRVADFLTDAHFPLRKGALANARGSYGVFVAVMSPLDFLRLTTPDEAAIEKITGDEFATSIRDYKTGTRSGARRFNKEQYQIPFLNVEFPTGRVIGHEGRHRAAMVMKAGGTKFPVIIYFRDITRFEVTWRDATTGEPHSQMFDSRSDANTKMMQLRRDPNAEKVDYEGFHGYSLKGHPGRSLSAYQQAAWRKEDMPPFLIGQFNAGFRLPTSRLKLGLVKGYRHFMPQPS